MTKNAWNLFAVLQLRLWLDAIGIDYSFPSINFAFTTIYYSLFVCAADISFILLVNFIFSIFIAYLVSSSGWRAHVNCYAHHSTPNQLMMYELIFRRILRSARARDFTHRTFFRKKRRKNEKKKQNEIMEFRATSSKSTQLQSSIIYLWLFRNIDARRRIHT